MSIFDNYAQKVLGLPSEVNEALGLNNTQENPLLEGLRRVNKGIVNVGLGFPAQMAAGALSTPSAISEIKDNPLQAAKESGNALWQTVSAPYRPSNYDIVNKPVESITNAAMAVAPFMGMAGKIGGGEIPLKTETPLMAEEVAKPIQPIENPVPVIPEAIEKSPVIEPQKIQTPDLVSKPQETPTNLDESYQNQDEYNQQQAQQVEEKNQQLNEQIETHKGMARHDNPVPISEYENQPEHVKDAITDYTTPSSQAEINENEPARLFSSTKDYYNKLPQEMGPIGGELHNRATQGEQFNHQVQQTSSDLLDRWNETLDSIPEKERNAAVENVIKASENREKAPDILKDQTEKDLYSHMTNFFDYFKGLREQKGLKTIPNYYTHILDFSENPAQYLDERGMNNVPKDISSPFNIERKGGADYSKDATNTMRRYASSMGKFLSYDDLLKFYNDEYAPATKNASSWQKKMSTDYMRRFFTPDIKTKAESFIDKAMSKVYDRTLNYSPFQWFRHRLQSGFARAKVSGEGATAGAILRGMDHPQVQQFLDGQTAAGTNPFTSETSRLQKYGVNPSWRRARSYGAGEEIAQSEAYNQARKTGASQQDAVKAALQDPEVIKSAMNRGENLAQETQTFYGKSSTPDLFYDNRHNPVIHPFLMFGRRMLAFPEMLYNQFRPDAKALTIIKRGVSPEASVADRYLTLKKINEALPEMIKKSPEMAEDLQGAHWSIQRDLESYHDFINQVEKGPVRLKVLQKFMRNTLYGGTGALLLHGIGNGLKSMLGQKTSPVDPSAAYIRELPLSNAGRNLGKLSSPLIPETDQGWKGIGRFGVNMGVMATPFVGPLDYAIPGHLISGEINHVLGLESDKKQQ